MKKMLGMLTLAMGLTMITIVIFDLRNPMMAFLIGRPAQVYILLNSILAVASGVVLVRECFFPQNVKNARSGVFGKKNVSGKESGAEKNKPDVNKTAEIRGNAAAVPVSGTSAKKRAAAASASIPAAPEEDVNGMKKSAALGAAEEKNGAVDTSAAGHSAPHHRAASEFMLDDILNEEWK